MSGSRSASRLFNYTAKKHEDEPYQSNAQPVISERQASVLKSASKERVIHKYLKVEETTNCRFAPTINPKSVALDIKRKENLLKTMQGGN